MPEVVGALAEASALASEAVRSAGETWIGVGFAHLLSASVERDDAAGAWRSVVDRGVDGPLPEASQVVDVLRVAQMAAAGMTNRAIAQALFITRKTVELHLTKVYTKLGVSRTDLAAALHEHRQRGAGE